MAQQPCAACGHGGQHEKGYRVWIALPFVVAFATPLGGQKAVTVRNSLPAARESPLVLTETIPLEGVKGRFDHFASGGGQLFVAALGNNSLDVMLTFRTISRGLFDDGQMSAGCVAGTPVKMNMMFRNGRHFMLAQQLSNARIHNVASVVAPSLSDKVELFEGAWYTDSNLREIAFKQRFEDTRTSIPALGLPRI